MTTTKFLILFQTSSYSRILYNWIKFVIYVIKFKTFLLIYCYYISADLANESDTIKIIDQTINKFKKLDVLVNNAGIMELGSIENTSLTQYDTIMNTNVR